MTDVSPWYGVYGQEGREDQGFEPHVVSDAEEIGSGLLVDLADENWRRFQENW